MKCGRRRTGWYCRRDFHITGPCALVPRWWNIPEHLRYWKWYYFEE